MSKEHKHKKENGEVYAHTHEYGEEEHHHSHSHSPDYKKNVSNRLSKAIGHLNKVKSMTEDDVDCADVLVQLRAVRAALDSTSKYILKEHMAHCVAGEDADAKEIHKLIDTFL